MAGPSRKLSGKLHFVDAGPVFGAGILFSKKFVFLSNSINSHGHIIYSQLQLYFFTAFTLETDKILI